MHLQKVSARVSLHQVRRLTRAETFRLQSSFCTLTDQLRQKTSYFKIKLFVRHTDTTDLYLCAYYFHHRSSRCIKALFARAIMMFKI